MIWCKIIFGEFKKSDAKKWDYHDYWLINDYYVGNWYLNNGLLANTKKQCNKQIGTFDKHKWQNYV